MAVPVLQKVQIRLGPAAKATAWIGNRLLGHVDTSRPDVVIRPVSPERQLQTKPIYRVPAVSVRV